MAYALQVFFIGTCQFAFLRRAMTIESDPVTEGNNPLPAQDVLLVLATIEDAIAAQSACGSRRACIPSPSGRDNRCRRLTVAEAQRKIERVKAFSKGDPGWAKAVADELYRETRKESRTAKQARVLERLVGLVRKIVGDHNGAWTTLPPMESIAKTFNVSRRAVQDALNRLREMSVEFAFHAEARLDTTCGSRRGRCVRVALRAWLNYDEKPLLYDAEGKERGIRTCFRPNGEVLVPGPCAKASAEPNTEPQINEKGEEAVPDGISSPESAPSEPTTKCSFCLSHSERLYEPAVISSPKQIRETQPQISPGPSGPATPELKSFDRKKQRTSWGLARELRRAHFGDWDDSTLSYHLWRFALSLFVIQGMIEEALRDGLTAKKIKSVFEASCYETNAAVFDGLARNPGGLFRSVFRRRCARKEQPQRFVAARPATVQLITKAPDREVLGQAHGVSPAADTARECAFNLDITQALRAFRLSLASEPIQQDPTGPLRFESGVKTITPFFCPFL